MFRFFKKCPNCTDQYFLTNNGYRKHYLSKHPLWGGSFWENATPKGINPRDATEAARYLPPTPAPESIEPLITDEWLARGPYKLEDDLP